MASTARAVSASGRTVSRSGGTSLARSAAPRTAPARRTAPDLRIVPARRRKVVWCTVAGLAGLFLVLFAVTAFQTRIAQNQLDIDRLDDRIADQRDEYTRLRLERAGLMSPERLMAEAAAIGMVPGGATQFVTITPESVAEVVVSSSGVEQRTRARAVDPLDAYSDVKALMDGVPDGESGR